jgi:hypothetical protein
MKMIFEAAFAMACFTNLFFCKTTATVAVFALTLSKKEWTANTIVISALARLYATSELNLVWAGQKNLEPFKTGRTYYIEKSVKANGSIFEFQH